jgi:hypothetical protein
MPSPPVAPPGKFSHVGVTPGACFTCHNGAAARGKPGKHLPTSMSCDSCHRTTAWVPANFTHTGIAPNSCVTCHNGAGARGKPANHFVTAKSCDSCHRTTSWVPVTSYTHVSPAFVRHSGGVMCASCHMTNSEVIAWKFGGYKPDCAGCHAGSFKPEVHVKVESPKLLYSVTELKNCTASCHVYANPSLTLTKKTIPPRHRSTDGGF